MPMLASVLVVRRGFSSNSIDPAVGSAATMPKRYASKPGTERTAMVTSASRSWWKRSMGR